jgi:asparagine synthase (glutamine-hydrolysing)
LGSLAVVVPRSAPPDRQVVERMLAAASHRGTEFDVRICGKAALAVSNNPDFRDAWLASDNGITAAFAGTLDNRIELNDELERAGAAVADDSPASTVLAAFRTWGETAPKRFRGIFTGAVADGFTLRCFRDQIGFRTLFYRDDQHAFYAATEAKQVIAGARIPREPDMEGLEGLLFGDIRTNALRGVERFPSSSLASVNGDGRISFTRYWDPTPLLETLPLSVPEACERMVFLLEQVARRVVTGTSAVSLSGGIDSPTVAAFAAPRHLEFTGRPLLGISAVYPHLPSVDERKYIEIVRDYLGIELHTYAPKARSLDNVEFWVRILDAPVDTISMPALEENYSLARSLGARTVLSGEFGEYVYTMYQHLLAHLLIHGRWRPAARRILQWREEGHSWVRILRPLGLSLAPPFLATRYAHWRKRGMRYIPPWLDATKSGGHGYRPDLALPARRRWLELQVGPTGRGKTSPTLEADEICAAYCGVHIRRPLTDIDLWEFFLSLRAETKYPDRFTKGLVRQAMRGHVPAEILSRQDKTLFDAHSLATVDYPALRRWILDTNHRLDGVDYTMLRSRLEREELNIGELKAARDLARIHAFLETFE